MDKMTHEEPKKPPGRARSKTNNIQNPYEFHSKHSHKRPSFNHLYCLNNRHNRVFWGVESNKKTHFLAFLTPFGGVKADFCGSGLY